MAQLLAYDQREELNDATRIIQTLNIQLGLPRNEFRMFISFLTDLKTHGNPLYWGNNVNNLGNTLFLFNAQNNPVILNLTDMFTHYNKYKLNRRVRDRMATLLNQQLDLPRIHGEDFHRTVLRAQVYKVKCLLKYYYNFWVNYDMQILGFNNVEIEIFNRLKRDLLHLPEEFPNEDIANLNIPDELLNSIQGFPIEVIRLLRKVIMVRYDQINDFAMCGALIIYSIHVDPPYMSDNLELKYHSKDKFHAVMENREASVAHMGDNYLMKVCAKWTRNENSLRMPNGLIKVLGSVVDTRIENFFMNQEIFSHETVYVWIQNDLLPKLPHEFRPILWDDQNSSLETLAYHEIKQFHKIRNKLEKFKSLKMTYFLNEICGQAAFQVFNEAFCNGLDRMLAEIIQNINDHVLLLRDICTAGQLAYLIYMLYLIIVEVWDALFPALQQLIADIRANMPEIPRRINDFIDRNVRGVRSLTTEILNALYNCPGIDNYVGIQIISQYTDTNIIYINQYTQGDEDTKLIKRLARNRYLKFPSKQHFIYHLVKHYKKFNPMDLIDDLIDDFDRIAGLYHADANDIVFNNISSSASHIIGGGRTYSFYTPVIPARPYRFVAILVTDVGEVFIKTYHISTNLIYTTRAFNVQLLNTNASAYDPFSCYWTDIMNRNGM